MTEKIDGNLPETIRYGGFRCEYAGTTTFPDKAGGTWYRHEYAYCDAPHIKERVFFFRLEGDAEPIPVVTDFEIVRDVPRRDTTRRDYKGYQRKYQREYQRQKRARKMAEKLQVKKIRGQIKPFGGE